MAATPLAHQLLDAEEGTIYKVTADVRVALAYPNNYYIAMSNLGWQLVYSLLNRRADTLCERVCLPETPPKTHLTALESNTPLHQFDIVAFSVSFEQDYLNLLKILDLGGVRLEKAKRDKHAPLVIMGGICAFMNPEPLADFVDLFVLGEAEDVLDELIDAYKEGKEAGEDKKTLLIRLAQIPGIYVPQFYRISYKTDNTLAHITPSKEIPEKLQVRVAENLDQYQGSSQLFTPNTEFKDTCLIELSRGCLRACHFCLLGALYRPYRARNLFQVKGLISRAHQQGKKVGLLGAAVSDYPYFDKLIPFLMQDSNALGISSLRADSLSEALLQALFESGQKSVTIAPEAGSERLRCFINKGLSDSVILQAIERIGQAGFCNLKLYFMLGLPTEKSSDVEAIIDLTREIKSILLKHARPRGKMGEIVLSIGIFVPKPHTAFQWMPMEQTKTLEKKQKTIRKALAREGNVKLLFESPRQAFVQGLLARADRRMGKLLMAVYQNGGNWKEVIRGSDIDPEFYLYRQRKADEILPWQHLQSSQLKTYLEKRYPLLS